MTIIKCLSEKIEDELSDAQEYIDDAMRWKQDDPEVANLFYHLSTEEMGHIEKLHAMVAKIIEEYRAQNGEPPKEMMTLYDYLHQKHMNHAMEIKVKQGMYKA